MYHYYIIRQRDTFAFAVQLLRGSNREITTMMTPEARLYHTDNRLSEYQQFAHSSTSSISGVSGISGSTAATSMSMMSSAMMMMQQQQQQSTASSPSLRSRESVIVSNQGIRPASPSPGGNVKVVVRVRGYLPRGEILQYMRSK